MKKLLLFSALFILACSSSDDSESSNNFNPPEKLISSMYVSSIDCSNGLPYENSSTFLGFLVNVFYNNSTVSSSTGSSCEFDCYDGLIECFDETDDFWGQYVSAGMAQQSNFPLSNDFGNFFIQYNNNKISSKSPDDGSGLYHQYTWEDSKMSKITTYIDETTLMWSYDFNHSTYDNLTRLFCPTPIMDPGFLHFIDPIAYMGAFGDITTKLPSSITYKRWDEGTGDLESTTITNFIYEFDDEGYVTSFETTLSSGFKYTTTIEYQ